MKRSRLEAGKKAVDRRPESVGRTHRSGPASTKGHRSQLPGLGYERARLLGIHDFLGIL